MARTMKTITVEKDGFNEYHVCERSDYRLRIVATFATESEANAKADELRAEIAKRNARNVKARERRAMMDDAAEACGLVKVRGAVSGRIYYE